MASTKIIRWNPLAYQAVCLFMASLTACSTTRPPTGWHDPTPSNSSAPLGEAQPLTSWGANEQNPNAPNAQIAPGFLLTLNCLRDSKLNGDFRVDFDGNLQLPYDQTVNVSGDTLSQMSHKLEDLFHPYFKTPSEIDVRVKERRYWVDVRGLVEKPGRYLIEPESSLDLVIGLAGGPSKQEPPQYVRIQKGAQVFVLDMNQYYSQGEGHPQVLGWLGGEILFFQKDVAGPLGNASVSSLYRQPVYILGEVRKPGGYSLTPGSDFVDTLVQSGGFTEKADLDKIEVIRRVGARKRVYDFSWNQIQSAPTPRGGDVIFVHADNQTKTERRTFLITVVISALASIASTTVLILAYNHGGLGTR